MNILVVSHAAVLEPYQQKWRMLVGDATDIAIALVTPHVWVEGGRRRAGVAVETDTFCVIPHRVRFAGQQFIHHYSDLKSTFQRHKPDVIHLDEEPPSVVARQVCRARDRWMPGVPIVVMAWENVNQRRPFYSVRRHLYRHCEKVVYRSVTRAIAGSAGAAQVLRERGFCRDVDVYPTLCVDTEKFRPRDALSLRRNLGLPTPIVGYVGRLIPEKGVSLLLEATAQAEGLWSAVLLGDGPERERLQRQSVSLGVSDRVRIVSDVSIQDQPEWMNVMDVLVLPSVRTALWQEQFGRVLIEAMACGVPVLGSSCGSIPEVIGDAGLIFREGDASHLKDQLQRMLSDPALLMNLKDRGLRRVPQTFSTATTAERLVGTYRKAVQESSR